MSDKAKSLNKLQSLALPFSLNLILSNAALITAVADSDRFTFSESDLKTNFPASTHILYTPFTPPRCSIGKVDSKLFIHNNALVCKLSNLKNNIFTKKTGHMQGRKWYIKD